MVDMKILRKFKHSIDFKLIIPILLLSLVLTFLLAGIRSYARHKDAVNQVNASLEYIGNSYVPMLNESLWVMDDDHVRYQMAGILNMNYIRYAVLRSPDSAIIAAAGYLRPSDGMTMHFELSYAYKGQKINLGSLEVIADRGLLKNNVLNDLYITLIEAGITILVLSICILLLFHRFVTTHLQAMAKYVHNINIKEEFNPLILNRNSLKPTGEDELDEVASAINKSFRRLNEYFNTIALTTERLNEEVAERNEMATAMQESQRLLANIIDFLPDATLVIDRDNKVIAWNRAIEAMTGVKAEEMLGKGGYEYAIPFHGKRQPILIDLVLHPDLTPSHKYTAIQRTGDMLFGEAYTPRLGPGKIHLSATSSVLRNSAGESIGAIECIRNSTERRELEERLQRSEKMESLGMLAGGVAHDLNNVLGTSSLYTELIKHSSPKESAVQKYADNILSSTQKAAAIIADMLTLARRNAVVPGVINVNGVVSGFLESPAFEEIRKLHRHVAFRAELDPNLLNIKGSAIHLEKTVMNLLSNAMEAISGEGEVTIRTENQYLDRPIGGYEAVSEGDYAVLTVSDTGIGIADEHIKRIFEPFYTKKTMGKSGTGLGLAIVWGTVKDHNGYIYVQSELGRGTTFTLYFPVTREKIPGDLREVPIEQYMGHGESVLVVDDVAEQRQVAKIILTRLGYQVHDVSSGEDAVEYLRSNRVDILALDMIMEPGIDGLETYRRIREINPTQKAIIVSGFSETNRVMEAQALGAGAYVRKPYIIEKIGMAIQAELGKT